MSIFPRPLKKVLDKIIPFSQEDKVPTFNLGSGTANNTTFLRGDGTWASPGSSGYVPYIGATQDVDLGTYKISADAVEFSLTPVNAAGAGQIVYDGASGALSYLLNNSNVLSRIGQTMHAYVHNAEAVTITKGQAVYLFSASGNKASVKLANNTSDATSAKTFGLAAENIGAGQNGMVICQGVLDGLNTGMYTAGDTLYLGNTAGSYTNVKPYAPNHFVYVGIVERANAGNGQIYVRVQNGYELDEIHDVDLITTPPVNGNVLTYNGSLWVPQAPGGGGITVGTTSVTSGTVGRVFFQGTGNVVQQDSALFWDNTNKRLGVGATPSTSVRLDVRAQGALSTDIAFRVRNSADTSNIISIAGNGQFTLGLGASTAGPLAVAIGNNATTGTTMSTVIGGNASSGVASDASLAVGYASSVTGYRGVALGFLSNITGGQGISIGERASVTATNGIAIGSGASVSANGSFVVGNGSNAIANSNAFSNGLNGYSFFNDINSNYVINSAIIPVNNVSYLNNTKNVLYLGTGINPASTIKNGVQIYTNYRTITQASSTVGATATGFSNLKTITFSAGANMSSLTVGSRLIITNSAGEQTHANIVSVVGQVVTIDTALVNINSITLNANATTVTNSSVVIVSNFHTEIRNDQAKIIKLYQETTAVASSTLVGGGGTTLTDTDTFDGYTLKQIVKALRNQGILA